VKSGVTALILAVSLILTTIFSGIAIYRDTATIKKMEHTTNSSVSEGVLSVLFTDPPHVSDGVTRIYITYSDLAVHVAQAENSSRWIEINSHGTLELMGMVNISQTISTVNIASEKYNLITFNLSSALVTYNGKNYTAFIPSNQLILPIIGGIKVNSSKSSAVIIDMEPTVFNIGSTSNPQFLIKPVAKAYPIPSSEVNEQLKRPGFRMKLVERVWWKQLQERFSVNLQISASLTADSLNLDIKNTGINNTKVKVVVISYLETQLKGNYGKLLPALFGSQVFIVQQNGTLVPLQISLELFRSSITKQKELANLLIHETGYSLKTGASVRLTYNGTIMLGFGLGFLKDQPRTITSGHQYLVTLLGDTTIVSTAIVAK
jgi:hypothetical protein